MSSHPVLILRHAWREQRTLLWSVLFVLLLAALFCRLTGTGWWNAAEPVITLATLVVGVIIWFGEAAEDWEESLPKRLTVEFWLDPPGQPARLVMTCLKAPLTGESDIRTWGIALGGLMIGKRELKYDPYFITRTPEVVPDDKGQPCRHYVIRFTLEEMPERLAQLETSQGHSLRLQWASAQGRHREDILSSSTS